MCQEKKIIAFLPYTVVYYCANDNLSFSCFFDGVNGGLAQFFLVTLPFSLILIVNTTLYVITWAKLRFIEKKLSLSLGKQSSGSKMKHAAVRAMSLFVLAFIFQWLTLALFGIWVFVDPVTQAQVSSDHSHGSKPSGTKDTSHTDV